MITLSNDFERRASLNDNRRLLAGRIYYSDTEYLPVATHSCIIGSIQYYGILLGVDGSSSKWNLMGENNNVSISSPSISIAKYTSADGTNILDLFAQTTFAGRRVEIRAGYEDQEWENMLPFVKGIIDEVKQKLSEIELVLEQVDFTEAIISGRKIDTYANRIGNDYNYSYIDLLDKANDRVLPVVFGKQWCSPTVPVGYENTTSGLVYAVHDNTWLNNAIYGSGYYDLFTIDSYLQKQYQFNRNVSGYMLYGVQKDMYVPYYETNYYYGQTSWIVEMNQDYNFPSYKITQEGIQPTQNNTKLEEALFCEVPLRYETLSGASYGHGVWNGTIYGADGNLFDFHTTPQIVVSGNAYTTTGTPNQALVYRWNGQLDLNKNVRTDYNGRIRKARRISIPEVDEDNTEALETVLYGKIGVIIESGYAGHSTFPVALHTDRQTRILTLFDKFGVFTFRGHNFYGTPPTTSGTFNEDTNLYYIGAYATPNGTDFTGDNLLFINSDSNISGTYQYVTTTTAMSGLSSYTTPDYGGVTNDNHDVYRIYEAGQYGSSERANKLGRLRRDALQYPIYTRFQVSGVYLGRPRIDIYGVYGAYSYAVETPYDGFLFAPVNNGAYVYYTDHMVSTSGLGSNYYVLRRPIEYIDAMIRQASGLYSDYDTESWKYSTIYPRWSGMYSDWRDYSGGVLTEETLLNTFIKDYIKNELFTTFIDENGLYRFVLLASGYSSSDIIGDLDYLDSTDFEVGLTPTENVKCEIKSLKTDRMVGMEDEYSYVNNIGWRLDETQYDYSMYDARNTVTKNKFYYDEIKKPFTSSVNPDIVLHSGVYYSANLTNKGILPTNTVYWTPVITGATIGSYTTWDADTRYKGEDGENFIIAKRLLNWYANRHREITFETNKLEYAKYQIGDIVGVQNMPESCLGQNIRGFNGNANSFTTTVNGQTFYSAFILTSVKKGLDKITLIGTQLCALNSYDIVKQFYGRSGGSAY